MKWAAPIGNRRLLRGAVVGVALAAALIAVSLAGAPLYVSSVSSAAVQDQLRQACGSESALDLWVPSTGVSDVVAAMGAKVPHVQPSVLNTVTDIKLDLPLGSTSS